MDTIYHIIVKNPKNFFTVTIYKNKNYFYVFLMGNFKTQKNDI